MIVIKEQQAKKLPGLTSFCVSFDYNKQLVSCIKAVGNTVYDEKQHTWEMPLTGLAQFIDAACMIDSIELNILKDTSEPKGLNQPINWKAFKTKPYDYQKEGIEYGLTHDNWLLLDAPGLGKTLQMICLAEEMKRRNGVKHCLIICGINALKHNWKNEIAQHSKLSCRILGERINKKGVCKIGSVKDRIADLHKKLDEFFIITNIETIRDPDIIKGIKKGANKFDMVVVDEIHTCKSSESQQGKNLLKLTSIKYKIGLTGTLLVTAPLDCYTPLKFIGAEHGTLTNFKYYYSTYGGVFGKELIGYKNLNILKNQLNQVALRRTKDILNLPPKNIVHEYLEMDSSQEQFYENIKQGIIDQVDKVKMCASSVLGMVLRLRQATACPSILTTEKIGCIKLDRAEDLAQQILSDGVSKVVIFGNFKETVAILAERLKQYNPVVCTGDVKDEIVDRNIKSFQQNPDCRVFLGTWQRAGTGITLTAASDLIFVDTPWSAAQAEQAEDRIHRIGTNKSVFIHYLWTNNTVDLNVKNILQDKSLISSYIIDDEVPPQLYSRLRQIVEDL